MITNSPTLRPVGSAPFWHETASSVGEIWKSLYTFFGFSPANTATANKITNDAATPISVALIGSPLELVRSVLASGMRTPDRRALLLGFRKGCNQCVMRLALRGSRFVT